MMQKKTIYVQIIKDLDLLIGEEIQCRIDSYSIKNNTGNHAPGRHPKHSQKF